MKYYSDMSKKQAISTILAYFQNKSDLDMNLCMALKILSDMRDCRLKYGKSWTEESIKASIERYIANNGRVPSVMDMDSDEQLPNHYNFNKIFGMTAGKWMRENYPNEKYRSRSKDFYSSLREADLESLKKTFLSEYQRILPQSAIEYNRGRDKNTPGWFFLASCFGVRRWRDLVHVTGADKIPLPPPPTYQRPIMELTSIIHVNEKHH